MRAILLTAVLLLLSACDAPVPRARGVAIAPEPVAPAGAAAAEVPAAPAPEADAPADETGPMPHHEEWNGDQIAWRRYDEGIREAKAENKPILLVVYTTWCPHCRNYSQVFSSPDVVAKARDFVMIRIDADASPAVSRRFAPDGEYIPRTFFLSPDGMLAADLHPARPRFKYFYDERTPADLLAGMASALRRFAS